MLLSMTGYGRATKSVEAKTITVEIRSLNSKFTDLRFKLPQNYKEKEIDLRRIITKRAERGKVDALLDVKSLNGEGEFGLNKALFNRYYRELSTLRNELDIPNGDMLQSIIRLPNVITAEESSIDPEEWKVVLEVLGMALDNFMKFRLDEGKVMEEDCRLRINNILEYLGEIKPHETARVEKVRKRINQHMEEYVGKDNIDANRFEQEILYYLEKIDITEEKVRLEQHCHYFLEELEKKTTQKGRKLSFIGQEIGREINTLGSKANSSDIQRSVVKMKDELEKIKEQVANTV